MRTTPNISDLLQPLEDCISEKFLPILLQQYNHDRLRKVFSLPAKLGGLSIFDPTFIASKEYEYSVLATKPLTELILSQQLSFEGSNTKQDIRRAKESITLSKNLAFKLAKDELLKESQFNAPLKLLAEKGSSLWLTTLPIANLGFVMNKQEFNDALCLRYNLPVTNMPNFCACGKPNNVDHALSCAKGGYTYMRHDNIRDTEAKILSEVCRDVTTEPHLIPSTELGNQARLDISARGVWSALDKTLFDVRIFHPGCKSYQNMDMETIYKRHEREKKNKYLEHVTNREKCSFTPLIFSTSGGEGPEAAKFHKRLATLLSKKRNILYSEAISYVRRLLRFSILRTTLIALRGYRGKHIPQNDITNEDLNLIPHESRYEHLT